MKHQIMAIKINGIRQHAVPVQEVLTEHGCLIQTRLGFHESSGMICSDTGLIILLLQDKSDEIKVFQNALHKIDGVSTATISL